METERITRETSDEQDRYPHRTQHPRAARSGVGAEAAELANKEKDQMLAAICHDLRAPLQAVLGWAEVARRLSGNSTVSEALSRIETSVHTQEVLINDILNLTRGESCALRIERINLQDTVQESLMIVEPSAAEKGVKLQFNRSATPAVILGDRMKIQRILWNLLTNAVKFTPVGGLVVVEVHRDHRSCRIQMSDSGCGVNPSFLPRIFGKFEQDSSSAGGGTARGIGLGLAIVHRLVEMHGGRIEAESPGKDQGATFTISLPAADAALQQTDVNTDAPN